MFIHPLFLFAQSFMVVAFVSLTSEILNGLIKAKDPGVRLIQPLI